jgi:hypothetical protein
MITMPTTDQPARSDREVVERLVEMIAGTRDTAEAATVLHPQVISHMDGLTFQGIGTWQTWLAFLRAHSRIANLTADCDRIETNPNQTLTVYGRWRGDDQGKPASSNEVWATYRVQDGLVVEIWTTRTNYPFILGPIIRFRLGLLLVLAYVGIWSRWPRRAERAS